MKLMKANARALYVIWFMIPVLLLFVSGCGGGGTETATVDVTGSWNVTETITESSGICAVNVPVGTVSIWSADAVQNGNNVTVTITAGDNVGSTFTGTISGNQVDWHGTYSGGGGTVTITGTDVTATSTTFSGSSSWEWTDGNDSCSGQTTVTGNKV
ncbi:MAG: hypothetical protein WC956_00390 [bacterium]